MIAPDRRYIDCFIATLAVSFTCTVCTDPASESGSPDAIFASFARKVGERYKTDKLDRRMGSLTCGSSSLGPVALYVCRESKQIAMQRYELAFGGVDINLDGPNPYSWVVRRKEDKEEWERRRLGEKRIWVDFQRDVILVDGHWRRELYAKCSPREPLTLLRTYAKEEAAKIRRLAIGAVSGNGEPQYDDEILRVILTNKIYPPLGAGRQMISTGELGNEYLRGFDSVEDLLLDDTVGAKDRDEGYPVGGF